MPLLKTVATTVAAAALSVSSSAQATETRSALNLPAPQRMHHLTLQRTSMIESESRYGGDFPFLIVFVVIAAGLGLYFAVDGGGGHAGDTP